MLIRFTNILIREISMRSLYLVITTAWFFINAMLVLGQDDAPSLSVETISIPNLPAYTVDLSPDGNKLAVFVGNEAQIILNIAPLEYRVEPTLLPIRLINPITGEELNRLAGGTDYIRDVAFTSTGDILASYHSNGDIILWNTETGEEIRTVKTLTNGSGIAFMADDKTLLVSIRGITPHVFLVVDSDSGAIAQLIQERFDVLGELGLMDMQNQWDYQYVAWTLSPTDDLLATANANGEVKLWDMESQEQTILTPRAEDLGRFNIRSLEFSNDGSTLIYYDQDDEQTHFWSILDQEEIIAIPAGDRKFAFDAEMNRLAWATFQEVWITDIDQPENTHKILEFDSDLRSIASVTFAPDDKHLIIGGFSLADDEATDNSMYVITLDD
jgi:WD40 repeat protein